MHLCVSGTQSPVPSMAYGTLGEVSKGFGVGIGWYLIIWEEKWDLAIVTSW